MNDYNIVCDCYNVRKSRGVISPNRSVRTRLYFTSESHIHSLVNYLKYGDLLTVSWLITIQHFLYFVLE